MMARKNNSFGKASSDNSDNDSTKVTWPPHTNVYSNGVTASIKKLCRRSNIGLEMIFYLLISMICTVIYQSTGFFTDSSNAGFVFGIASLITGFAVSVSLAIGNYVLLKETFMGVCKDLLGLTDNYKSTHKYTTVNTVVLSNLKTLLSITYAFVFYIKHKGRGDLDIEKLPSIGTEITLQSCIPNDVKHKLDGSDSAGHVMAAYKDKVLELCDGSLLGGLVKSNITNLSNNIDAKINTIGARIATGGMPPGIREIILIGSLAYLLILPASLLGVFPLPLVYVIELVLTYIVMAVSIRSRRVVDDFLVGYDDVESSPENSLTLLTNACARGIYERYESVAVEKK